MNKAKVVATAAAHKPYICNLKLFQTVGRRCCFNDFMRALSVSDENFCDFYSNPFLMVESG
jgi:hypothetical protein